MPTIINIKRKRGDTRRMVFVVKDTDGDIIPVNTWGSFLLTVDPSKEPTDNSNNILQITGSLASDGLDGRIAFSPDGAADIGSYFYDVQAIDGNGEKGTIAEGSYKLTQDITKD